MSMRSIYRKIAKRHNVSLEEVKREMQAAVDFAYHNASKDETAAAKQKQISRKGEIPTAEEFILYAAEKIKQETEQK